MKWNPNTAIVGFVTADVIFDEAYVRFHLGHAPGFVRPKWVYTLTRAVLIEVNPTLLDRFVAEVSHYDMVEYCEYNSVVNVAGFEQCLPPTHEAFSWDNTSIRSIHDYTDNPSAGEGIRVALIDTGLSPHPFLPRTSFSEVSAVEPSFAELDLVSQREIMSVVNMERTNGSVFDRSSWRTYRQTAKDTIDLISARLQAKWSRELSAWTQAAKNASVLTTSHTVFPPVPSIPMLDSKLTAHLRRISLDSYNFVDDSMDVEDRNGHGTQMAGLLAARSPLATRPPSPSLAGLQDLEVDLMGLAPEAEYVILKCLDSERFEESNIDTIIRAFEHIRRIGVSVVYLGLSVSVDSLASMQKGRLVRRAMALDRVVAEIARDTIVVCPAGNNGKAGLEVPASASNVVAVTAIAVDSAVSSLRLACESNWADTGAGESVSFCGFGGELGHSGAITTGRHFGYSLVSGTSVAAAVIAGLFAQALSKHYVRERDVQYRLLQAGLLSPQSPMPQLQLTIPRPQKAETIKAATQAAGSLGAPERYGSGLLKAFSI